MKLPREKLEDLKRRGVKVIGEKPKPKAEAPARRPAQPVEKISPSATKEDTRSVERSEAAAAAAKEAANDSRDILRDIAKRLSIEPAKPGPPVAYKFTMKRDRQGILVEVIATPIGTKDQK